MAARVALQILNGSPASSIEPLFLGPAAPEYDWRELRRWGINESRLPQGSVVQFRSPSLWEQYRWYIIGALAIITVQALLIVGLLLHRARQHRAEKVNYGKVRSLWNFPPAPASWAYGCAI